MYYICFNILLSFRFSWIDKQSVVFCCFFGCVVLGYVCKQTLDFETTPPCAFLWFHRVLSHYYYYKYEQLWWVMIIVQCLHYLEGTCISVLVLGKTISFLCSFKFIKGYSFRFLYRVKLLHLSFYISLRKRKVFVSSLKSSIWLCCYVF